MQWERGAEGETGAQSPGEVTEAKKRQRAAQEQAAKERMGTREHQDNKYTHARTDGR